MSITPGTPDGSGSFTAVVTQPHQCVLPVYDANAPAWAPGTQWQCDPNTGCGAKWIFTSGLYWLHL